MTENKPTGAEYKSILVVGGGISGISTAIEAAELGYEVYIVDEKPYLGGRVAKLNQYFPKLCPPTCGLEINFRRIKQNPQIRVFTSTNLTAISGQAGNYQVTLNLDGQMVNENCTACNECVEVCPHERDNDFNYNMDKTKAIYLPHLMSYPAKYTIDDASCPGKECNKCVEACKYDAIDLDATAKEMKINVGTVVFATGWSPYDANNLDNLQYGISQNVITNVMMERLAAHNGPTGGKIVRPSDGKEVNNIAFVQCAGSRDENHLPYCSAVCCLASLKQATYVRNKNTDSKAEIFYIDVRALGRLEDFYQKVEQDENVTLTRGKVAEISEDPETKDVILKLEDTEANKRLSKKFEMVVLASGMVPNGIPANLGKDLQVDEYGFLPGQMEDGIFAVGCAKMPADVSSCVQEATGTAMKATLSLR